MYLAELPYLARRLATAHSEGEVRAACLSVIDALLRAEMWRAGDVRADGFHPWELSPVESYERIAREWYAGRELIPGDICWFENTAHADERANELLRAGYRGVV